MKFFKGKSMAFWQLVFNASMIVAIVALLVWHRSWASPTISSDSGGVIPYQGTLVTDEGERVNGQVSMTFRLYNVPSDGSPLWEESYTGSNAVQVQNGLFQVNLGSLVPIPAAVWNSQPLYLGVQVEDDPEMSPRSVIGSVPYALHVASNAITSDSVADGSITRNDLAPFTGVVWKVPPSRLREDVAWTPDDNAVWDIGPFLDSEGVPSDAEVLLLGWWPSRWSDFSTFELLDANGQVLGTVVFGSDVSSAWAPVGIPYGTMIPVPGGTRKIRYRSHGGSYRDFTNPRRVLFLFGWK